MHIDIWIYTVHQSKQNQLVFNTNKYGIVELNVSGFYRFFFVAGHYHMNLCEPWNLYTICTIDRFGLLNFFSSKALTWTRQSWNLGYNANHWGVGVVGQQEEIQKISVVDVQGYKMKLLPIRNTPCKKK